MRAPHHDRPRDVVRVATVQYAQRRIAHYREFADAVGYFVGVAADYRCDFVVFPELFTLQLLSIAPERLAPQPAVEALTAHTAAYRETFAGLAREHGVNIVAGSHPAREAGGRVLNTGYLFHRDGRVSEQPKIHATPSEASFWGIEGGDTLEAIDTDCGPVGLLVCYDVEFPELSRRLAEQGARIVFVPLCTDDRQGYLRVRYCCHARAVENQCYLVLSGNCGNLPGVGNMDIQYARSCILTPCDVPFARDGVAVEADPNVETLVFADLDLALLDRARSEGTVRNLNDRRGDLYRVEWKKGTC